MKKEFERDITIIKDEILDLVKKYSEYKDNYNDDNSDIIDDIVNEVITYEDLYQFIKNITYRYF